MVSGASNNSEQACNLPDCQITSWLGIWTKIFVVLEIYKFSNYARNLPPPAYVLLIYMQLLDKFCQGSWK